MTRPPKAHAKPPTKSATAASPPDGDRIAKVLSRAGIASRREAERMIAAGEVAVNGKVIDSPALNVSARDRITVNGQPLAPPEPPRLWLYYKPEGLVTSAADEKGRDTVFDHLPEDMPRVMSVGRLDLNSEGLLLLTNDGELKRRLELPSTGWLRKYRVRVKGNPTDPDLEPLRKGITIDGKRFQPMEVKLDRHQGANAWLTVGLREGKNREIRRAMAAINLTVNRLIRISYGPFRLNELQPGEVEEVRPKVLRDQLGLTGTDADGRPDPKPSPKPAPKPARKTATPGARTRGPAPAQTATRFPARGKPADAAAPRGATLIEAPPARRASAKPGTKPAAAPGKAPAKFTARSAPPAKPTAASGKPAPRGTAPADGAKPGPRTPSRPGQPPRRPR